MSKRVSLAEIMGKSGSELGSSGKLKLSSLAEILGDAMPELPKNAVGRHRLIRALQQRFGHNWRSLPGVKDLVKEFDESIEFERKLARIRQIRYTAKEK